LLIIGEGIDMKNLVVSLEGEALKKIGGGCRCHCNAKSYFGVEIEANLGHKSNEELCKSSCASKGYTYNNCSNEDSIDALVLTDSDENIIRGLISDIHSNRVW
jgi:hypothetical protein